MPTAAQPNERGGERQRERETERKRDRETEKEKEKEKETGCVCVCACVVRLKLHRLAYFGCTPQAQLFGVSVSMSMNPNLPQDLSSNFKFFACRMREVDEDEATRSRIDESQ